MVVFLFLFAYLCGSIPFGKLMGLAHGIDVQQRGSGNIGFANVQRLLGWRAGIPTLIGDIAKGFLPTLLAVHFYGQTIGFLVGVVAIAGHLFPVWLHFKGGKGIATGFGVLLALQPTIAILGIVTYGICFWASRNSAFSSIIGTTCAVLVGTATAPGLWWQYCLLLVIALWTHRKNIAGSAPDYDI